VLVNVLSINLAALVVLWYSGYRPERFFRVGEARSALVKRAAVLVFAIAVLSAFLGGVTYASFQSASTEQAVREGVEEVTATQPYEDVTLLSLSYEYETGLVVQQPTKVVVTLGVPPGSDYPALPNAVNDRIDERANRNVTVEVRYVQFQRVG